MKFLADFLQLMKPITVMAIKLTRHGKQRMKERLGLPKRALRRHVKIVLKEGLTHNQLNGSLLSYINWQVIKFRHNCNRPIVHGHHLYIFNDDTLITVLELPTKLKCLADRLNHKNNSDL